MVEQAYKIKDDKKQAVTDSKSQSWGDKYADKAYHATTFYGVGWLLNAGISIVAAQTFKQIGVLNRFKESLSGKLSGTLQKTKIYGKSINILEKWKLPNPQGIGRRAVDKAVNILLLSSGGFLTLLPMKWMESHKATTTKYFGKQLNNLQKYFGYAKSDKQKTAIELYQDKDLSSEDMGKMAAQSWFSLILSRVFTLIPIMSFYIIEGERHNIRNHKKHGDINHIENINHLRDVRTFTHLEEWGGNKAVKFYNKLSGSKATESGKRWADGLGQDSVTDLVISLGFSAIFDGIVRVYNFASGKSSKPAIARTYQISNDNVRANSIVSQTVNDKTDRSVKQNRTKESENSKPDSHISLRSNEKLVNQELTNKKQIN